MEIVLITTSQMVNFDSSLHFNVIYSAAEPKATGKKQNNFIFIFRYFPIYLKSY